MIYMRKLAVSIDLFLDKHRVLLFFFTLIVFLRIPNLFEPYWYGDEAIYLTIGNALRSGERLYADIIDHKTPIIYLLATTPSQLWFRLLLMAWMLATTAVFWRLLQQLKLSSGSKIVGTLCFVLATTLPALEGNIPNGELFLMLFSFLSLSFFLKALLTNLNGRWLFLSGVFGSLSILTKVPGMFDLAPIGVLGLLYIWDKSLSRHNLQDRIREMGTTIRSLVVPMLAGLSLPVVMFLLLFAAQGSLPEFFQFGVLYNFRYAGSWQPTFPLPFAAIFFRFPVKVAFLVLNLATLILIRKKISTNLLFFGSWFAAALFATTLSNRPYPHYFLQVVPPLAGLIAEIWQLLRHNKVKSTASVSIKLSLIVLANCLISFILTTYLLGLYVYPTWSYYTRFVSLISGRMTPAAYQNSFDSLVRDNTRAALVLETDSNPYLYIWGTNPTLYAQSYKNPTGLFTVAFHVHDFKAYDEEIAAVRRRTPTFIVVMNNERDSFPELNAYLQQYYAHHLEKFDHFTLWRRRP